MSLEGSYDELMNGCFAFQCIPQLDVVTISTMKIYTLFNVL